MSDPVHSPKHYMINDGLEVIDVRRDLLKKMDDLGTPATQIDAWSRAWEYMTRGFFKDGLQDMKKARWYLDQLIFDMTEEEHMLAQRKEQEKKNEHF